MKKILSFLLVLSMLLCSGCTVVYDDTSSSDTYYEYSSDVIYVYENGTKVVDDVISQIEAEISQKEQDGEITVSREESVYVTDEEDDSYADENETGKQSAIVDSEIDSAKAEEIVEADINTTGPKPLYYTFLSESQQRIYRLMKTAAEQMTTGLFSLGAVSSDEDRFNDITIAFRALSSDNPQIFWLPAAYIMSPDGSALAFSYKEKGVDYTFTAEQKAIAESQLNAAVKSLSDQANKFDSRFEKELFFHDWLCENVIYDKNDTDNVYTAYGALVDGVAVCEGYSRAMQLLCDSVGIPCTVVYGSSHGVGHMWNIINPGDGWYHLDITWDDDEKYDFIRHAYVNLSDEQIEFDHKIFDAVYSGKSYVGIDDFNLCLYACNKQKYNYFEKNKLVFGDDIDAAVQIITKAANNGQTRIELLYTGSNNDYGSLLGQINRELYESGSHIWIKEYSYLNNAIALLW